MGDGTSSRRKEWILSQSSFDRLLSSFDADRDRAGEQYEIIRRKLVKFFECRSSPSPEDEADEAISRVARRIRDGEVIENLPAYFYGVARMLLRETLRERRQEQAAVEAAPVPHPFDQGDDEDARLLCLERCLDTLPDADRELLVGYYQGDKSARIRHRQVLADRERVAMNALRIRVHRLRTKIEQRVLACLGRTGV